jgi:hypothetical protein
MPHGIVRRTDCKQLDVICSVQKAATRSTLQMIYTTDVVNDHLLKKVICIMINNTIYVNITHNK